jgi:hypothetical protein
VVAPVKPLPVMITVMPPAAKPASGKIPVSTGAAGVGV